MQAIRRLEVQLEEEIDGWPNEERGLPPRPGRLLGRGSTERYLHRQGELLG
jgi:hypothetical protein